MNTNGGPSELYGTALVRVIIFIIIITTTTIIKNTPARRSVYGRGGCSRFCSQEKLKLIDRQKTTLLDYQYLSRVRIGINLSCASNV